MHASRDPTWRPSLGPDNATFRMVDLLLFALRGQEEAPGAVGLATERRGPRPGRAGAPTEVALTIFPAQPPVKAAGTSTFLASGVTDHCLAPSRAIAGLAPGLLTRPVGRTADTWPRSVQ
jgi:hypothetical protein